MMLSLPLAREMFDLQNSISFLDNNFSFGRCDFNCIKTSIKKDHSSFFASTCNTLNATFSQKMLALFCRLYSNVMTIIKTFQKKLQDHLLRMYAQCFKTFSPLHIERNF